MTAGFRFFTKICILCFIEFLAADSQPYVLPLKRDTVPVMKGSKVVSHKTAYYGTISVGTSNPQEFSVLFDTGSGHVILPSVECESEACLVHRRYNISKSDSAVAVNADGSAVPADEYCDQVNIGFGTGAITGEFVQESVCLGPARAAESSEPEETMSEATTKTATSSGVCTSVSMVVAVEMSSNPFLQFGFDGIMGLGLDSLALTKDFSFLNQLSRSQGSSGASSQFAVFLSHPEDAEGSELAVGGYNADRLMGPLRWADLSGRRSGHWQVQIRAVRIGDMELSTCKQGNCNAIVDTGTSHLGVPQRDISQMLQMLSKRAGDNTDCRLADAPTISIDIADFTLTLKPEDYMKPDPLRETLKLKQESQVSQHSSVGSEVVDLCRPKIMPVQMQDAIGSNTFILGEPALLRYYTVYDWETPRVGFGLARKKPLGSESQEAAAQLDDFGSADVTRSITLMQVTMTFCDDDATGEVINIGGGIFLS